MAGRDITLPVEGFKGLNLAQDGEALDQNELTVAKNVEIDGAGSIVKRKGWERIDFTSTSTNLPDTTYMAILGKFTNRGDIQLVVADQADVFSLNNLDATVRLSNGVGVGFANAEGGLEYNDNFYLFRHNDIMARWAGGSSFTEIAGSPSATHATIHKDRLFVINSRKLNAGNPEHRQRVWWSAIANFESWGGTDFIDVDPGDGDFIVAIRAYQDQLFIFKSKSTWVLITQGTSSGWELRNVSREYGCVSRHSIVEYNNTLYLMTHLGYYQFDGITFTEVSEKIRSVFRNRSILTPTQPSSNLWSQGCIDADHAVAYKDRIIISVGQEIYGDPAYGDSNNAIYVFNLRSGEWTFWDITYANEAIMTFLTLENIPQGSKFRAGLYAGNRSTLEQDFINLFDETTGVDKEGATNINVATEVQLAPFNADAPVEIKRSKGLLVHQGGHAAITVSVSVDGGSTWTVLADHQVSASGTTDRVIPVTGYGYFRQMIVKIATDAVTAWELHSLHHVITPKRRVTAETI